MPCRGKKRQTISESKRKIFTGAQKAKVALEAVNLKKLVELKVII
jgi:hypothetical protein